MVINCKFSLENPVIPLSIIDMGFRPAFSTSLSLSRDQASANSVFHGQCTCVLQRTARPAVIRAPKRAAVRMLGPFFPNLGDSKLLKSEIVRQEMLKLENDYAELAQLGQRYTVSVFYVHA